MPVDHLDGVVDRAGPAVPPGSFEICWSVRPVPSAVKEIERALVEDPRCPQAGTQSVEATDGDGLR